MSQATVQWLCAWIITLDLIMRFMVVVKFDFEGRPARQPLGFNGFIGTCLAFAIHAMLLYGAGVFEGLR